MRSNHLLGAAALALCALPAFAADTGGGSGGAADPVNNAAGNSTAIAGDPNAAQAAPEAPKPGAGPGPATGADPNPPNNAKAAKGKGKSDYVIWVQPGHEHFGIGQMLLVPDEIAGNLRAAGRARYASGAEIKAGKDAALKVESV